MDEAQADINNLEDHQGAYSEAILVKKAILRKMYDIIFYQEKFDGERLDGSVSLPYFNKWKVNLFSLYRLLRPMMRDEHYKEDCKEIKTVMKELMYNIDMEEGDQTVYCDSSGKEVTTGEKKLDVTQLYNVTDKMFDFIHTLGITDLEIKTRKGGLSMFEDD